MIDLRKRNRVIADHPELEEGITLSLEEFFDGNGEESSIAPNLSGKHPGIGRFREVLFSLRSHPGVTDVRIEVHEWPNPDQPLDDDLWIAADRVFVASTLSAEQVRTLVAPLLADDVSEAVSGSLPPDMPMRQGERIVAIWWD